jgi:hypothetical protein
MPTCAVDIYILPQRKVVSHKKNKSIETDVLVGEVWVDCTVVLFVQRKSGYGSQMGMYCSTKWRERIKVEQ